METEDNVEYVYYAGADRVTLTVKPYVDPIGLIHNQYTIKVGMMVLVMDEEEFVDLQEVMWCFDHRHGDDETFMEKIKRRIFGGDA